MADEFAINYPAAENARSKVGREGERIGKIYLADEKNSSARAIKKSYRRAESFEKDIRYLLLLRT
jgi:hypothetical protein